MKTILNCLKLCLSLFYQDGLPIHDAPDYCYCCELHECDRVKHGAYPAIPITLKLPREKKAEPERYDDRPAAKYDE